jgi:hypothetical protein
LKYVLQLIKGPSFGLERQRRVHFILERLHFRWSPRMHAHRTRPEGQNNLRKTSYASSIPPRKQAFFDVRISKQTAFLVFIKAHHKI